MVRDSLQPVHWLATNFRLLSRRVELLERLISEKTTSGTVPVAPTKVSSGIIPTVPKKVIDPFLVQDADDGNLAVYDTAPESRILEFQVESFSDVAIFKEQAHDVKTAIVMTQVSSPCTIPATSNRVVDFVQHIPIDTVDQLVAELDVKKPVPNSTLARSRLSSASIVASDFVGDSLADARIIGKDEPQTQFVDKTVERIQQHSVEQTVQHFEQIHRQPEQPIKHHLRRKLREQLEDGVLWGAIGQQLQRKADQMQNISSTTIFELIADTAIGAAIRSNRPTSVKSLQRIGALAASIIIPTWIELDLRVESEKDFEDHVGKFIRMTLENTAL